ncbi:MAG: hypothetical protein HZB19_13545 [Chloroflexi bacterium]|nr:hypothetical protein [Chloroflexota bacterium]
MAKKVKSDIAERNIRLTGVIMQYLIDHPKVFDVLPDKFELVVLPEDDPEISMFNLELLKKYGSQNRPIVFARIKTSELTAKAKPSIFVPVAA